MFLCLAAINLINLGYFQFICEEKKNKDNRSDKGHYPPKNKRGARADVSPEKSRCKRRKKRSYADKGQIDTIGSAG